MSSHCSKWISRCMFFKFPDSNPKLRLTDARLLDSAKIMLLTYLGISKFRNLGSSFLSILWKFISNLNTVCVTLRNSTFSFFFTFQKNVIIVLFRFHLIFHKMIIDTICYCLIISDLFKYFNIKVEELFFNISLLDKNWPFLSI
jgi:hypothetical protein